MNRDSPLPYRARAKRTWFRALMNNFLCSRKALLFPIKANAVMLMLSGICNKSVMRKIESLWGGELKRL